MFRGRRVVDDSSDDEEIPDIKDLLVSKPKNLEYGNATGTPTAQIKTSTAKNGTVRRRKLGAMVLDNPLLRPIGGDMSSSSASVLAGRDSEEDCDLPRRKKSSTTPQRIALRTRKTKPVITSVELDDEGEFSETGSVQEETILEDFSEGGDDDDASDFEANQDEDSDDDDFTAEFLSWSPSKFRRAVGRDSSEREVPASQERKRSPSPGAQLLAEAIEAQEREKKPISVDSLKVGKVKSETARKRGDNSKDLADPLSRLRK